MHLWRRVHWKIRKVFPNTTFLFSQNKNNFFNDANIIRTKVRSISSGPSNSKEHLIINPVTCLQDEPIHICAQNLPPGAEVTLTSIVKDARQQTFFTYAHYRADSSGHLDLAKDASIGGTYKGVFPMGSIAVLSPGPKEHKYLRFLKKDVEDPLVVNFKLLEGHADNVQACNPDPKVVLDAVTHRRLYMAPGTKRIPVRVGKLRGTLFLPEGEGPFPGVIDLFGTAGGLIEFRSAQFASRGIASLALAYMNFEDLPKDVEVMDLGYFEEAVHFLLGVQQVKKSGVGAVGVSKGGDLACSMGAFIPEVKAVACINGLPVNTWQPLKTKNKLIPGLTFDLSLAKVLNSQLINSLAMMQDSLAFPETFLPLAEADAEFLFLVAKDDQNWRTELETDRAVGRMKAAGKSNFEVLKYEGAGHLLEPPFSPFSYATYHKMVGLAMVWGGTGKQHSEAQVHSWERVITFIKQTL